MCFPQFFDQAFHMPGNRRGILLGIFQSGDQTENGVIHAGDGEGGAGFGRFDAAGQLVECVIGSVRSRPAILEGIGHFIGPWRFHGHQ